MFDTAIAGSLPKPEWLAETQKLWPQWKAEGAALQQAKLEHHEPLAGAARRDAPDLRKGTSSENGSKRRLQAAAIQKTDCERVWAPGSAVASRSHGRPRMRQRPVRWITPAAVAREHGIAAPVALCEPEQALSRAPVRRLQVPS